MLMFFIKFTMVVPTQEGCYQMNEYYKTAKEWMNQIQDNHCCSFLKRIRDSYS